MKNTPNTISHRHDSIRCLFGVAAALLLAAPDVSAQTPASLSFQTYAGLTITGTVDRVYVVQSTTDLAQPNAWQAATVLRLPSSPHLWVDTAGPAAGARYYRTIDGPTNLAWIDPGTFTMGSPADEADRFDSEGPQTVVTLTRGFFIGKYEVTQAEYVDVTGRNPSQFTGDLNLPVEQVSWFEARNFCQQLTTREQQAGRLPASWSYRLPTEAEWEFACRAGTTTRFSYGDDPGYVSLGNYAWQFSNANETHRVGQKIQGPWGLYDTSGNVWEWCQDWFASAYPGGRITDPKGPATGGSRVARGGAWSSFPSVCRASARIDGDPNFRGFDIGFRVVMAPHQP